jgi:small subunit ribosomal protein S8
MVSDHLSDLITRIRNGYSAKLETIEVPLTKTVEQVAKVLADEGYLESVKKEKNVLTITLKYAGRDPVITGIKRVSKPGARIYASVKNFPKVVGGLGINILTTPKGVISEIKAKKLNTGGEIIAQVW